MHSELAQAIANFQLTPAEFARLVQVTPRAVQLWLAGEREVPGPVLAYLRLFGDIPEAMRGAEIARLRSEDSKMFDGLYQMEYVGADGAGAGVLVFDRGTVYGSDHYGGKYDGTYSPNNYLGKLDVLDVKVRVAIRAGVSLVQGVPAQPMDYAFDIACTVPVLGESLVQIQTPFGPVGVKFKRMRDLPRRAA